MKLSDNKEELIYDNKKETLIQELTILANLSETSDMIKATTPVLFPTLSIPLVRRAIKAEYERVFLDLAEFADNI